MIIIIKLGSIQGRDDKKLDPTDYRLLMPKFTGKNAESNLKLVEKLKVIATRRNCSQGYIYNKIYTYLVISRIK